jgi:hypothetical protein
LEISLFCLRNRKFDAARRGFEKILRSGGFKTRTTEHYNIVGEIIKILKGSFNLRIDELEIIHVYLLFRLSCKIIPNEEGTLNMLERYRDLELKRLNDNEGSNYKNKSITLKNYIDVIYLDEYLKKEKNVIIEETLYYVKKYGTTTQLLSFFIDNNMLKETVDYIIENKITHDLFTNEVIEPCFKKREQMGSLCSSLKDAYLQKKNSLELIKEVIDFLKSKEAHIDLILLYELLNDYLQAALQAIHITRKTEDVETRIMYYNSAIKNLKVHLNNKETIIRADHYDDKKYIDRNSLERVLKLLNFQIKVLEKKKDIRFCLITDEEEDRYKIVQEIIILDDKLALDIINEYGLKVSHVFVEATKEYISQQKFKDFDVLFTILTDWKKDGIFAKFNENPEQLWNNILLQAICLIPLDDVGSITYVKENIISNFTEPSYRMLSYLWIGELENCFFIACELKDTLVISDIKVKALASGDTKVLDLIEKYYNNS